MRRSPLRPGDPTVTVAGEPVALTATETPWWSCCFAGRRPSLTRRVIATQVWEDEADAVGSNTIDVHMARLRAKLAGSHARSRPFAASGYRMVGRVTQVDEHRRNALRVAGDRHRHRHRQLCRGRPGPQPGGDPPRGHHVGQPIGRSADRCPASRPWRCRGPGRPRAPTSTMPPLSSGPSHPPGR